MHYLYFVKLAKDEATNNEEALLEAQRQLNDNSFANSEGSFFSSSRADWFVIGGRWSGEFQKIKIGTKFFEEVKKQKLFKDPDFVSTQDVEDNENKLQKIWKEIGGKGINIYNRDTYFGRYEDDAVKITAGLLKDIKKYYKNSKEIEVFCPQDYDEKNILDLNKSDIGDWLVVVDYHN